MHSTATGTMTGKRLGPCKGLAGGGLGDPKDKRKKLDARVSFDMDFSCSLK